MTYTKTVWKARQGTGLNRFNKTQETDDAVNLTNAPLTVTNPGTPFSEENMNHIEQGIWDAHEGIVAESQAREQGDNELAQAIEEETLARQESLSEEVAARHDADQILREAVDNEARIRQLENQNYQALFDGESQARQQGDNALVESIHEEIQARKEADIETLEEAKALIGEAKLATHVWIQAVGAKADLPLSGLDSQTNYLCRVIADPSPENNGVYQAVAGWDEEPDWAYFSDNEDWIDKIELEEAVRNHDGDENAHTDIREAVSAESMERQSADQNLQDAVDGVNSILQSMEDSLNNLLTPENLTRNNYNATSCNTGEIIFYHLTSGSITFEGTFTGIAATNSGAKAVQGSNLTFSVTSSTNIYNVTTYGSAVIIILLKTGE
jgi:hypothetical protein